MKSRLKYIIIIFTLIILGLTLRKLNSINPNFITRFAPDTLWAMMVYYLFNIVLPKNRKLTAIFSLGFSYLIELSQLYSAPWIDNIRSYRIGGLILGFGFLWTDLICYTIGILAALILDTFIQELVKMKR